MNFLMILTLILPLLSFFYTRWLPDKYLSNHKWLMTVGLAASNLVAIGIFGIIFLVNAAEFVQTYSVTWWKIAGHFFTMSLTLKPFTGLLLASWAASSLFFTILLSTVYFEPKTFRKSLMNLSLSTFAINGFILTNDLLTLLFFWALLDLCAYWIRSRNCDDIFERRAIHYLTIFENLLLLLAVYALFKTSSTSQIDAILVKIGGGEISVVQLLFSGVLIALVGIIRIIQPWLCSNSGEVLKAQPGDELIIYSGIIPSGLFLIAKLLPVIPSFLLIGLVITSGVIFLIGTLAIVAKRDFIQFLRLNTILQMSLIILTYSINAVALGAFFLIGFLALNLLLIIFICDFQPVSATGEAVRSSGSALIVPVRIVLLFGLIGLPFTMTCNARLLLLETVSLFGIAGSASRSFLMGMTGALFLLNTLVVFRLFLVTGALRPASRKTSPPSPMLQWFAGGLSILCLYPFYTFPRLNPLTTVLNGMALFSSEPTLGPRAENLPIVIVYTGLLLAGLTTGFIFSKYLNINGLMARINNYRTGLRTWFQTTLHRYLAVTTQKAARFDTVLLPEFGFIMTKHFNRVVNTFNRLNDKCARRFIQLEAVPTAFSERIFQRIQQLKFYNLILIVLLILSITILICII